jgi:hypothetical protein
VRKKKGGEVGIFQPPLHNCFSLTHPLLTRSITGTYPGMTTSWPWPSCPHNGPRTRASRCVLNMTRAARVLSRERVYARSCVGGLGHNIFSILTPATPP